MISGITTYRLDGSILLDGLTKGGVLVDVLKCPAGTSGSKSYPRTQAAGLHYFVARQGGHKITLQNQGGTTGIEGAVKWETGIQNPGQFDTYLYVFARSLATVDSYGLSTVNDLGEILVDPGFPVPQFVGSVNLSSTGRLKYTTYDNYTAHVHATAAFNLRPGADKIILMAMPDSGTDDTWYCLRKDSVLSSEGSVVVEVVVYTKAADYQLPTLHVYAVNSLQDSGNPYGMKLYNAQQQLTFDSSAEGMSIKDQIQAIRPDYGSTNTYTLAVSNLPGVTIPYYNRSKLVNAGNGVWNTERYIGVAKKVGSQYTLGVVYDARIPSYSSSGDTASYGGSGDILFLPVVDVSRQGGASYSGTPAASFSAYPSFVTHPQNKVVDPNTSTTFSVAVAGTPAPTLQWYKNDVAIAGATGVNYTFTTGPADETFNLHCVATNEMGSAASAAAFVIVTAATQPVISNISPPSGSARAIGASVTVSFTATGNPTPEPQIALDNGTVVNSNSYTFIAGSDPAPVMLRASNSVKVTETPYQLYIGTAPVFTVQPTSKSVGDGNSVTFTAETSNNMPTSYRWYRNGVAVGSDSSSASYTLTATLGMSGDQYYCRATNGVGTTQSNTVTLTVSQTNQAPTITSAATASATRQGGTTTLSVGVNGYPAPSVVWTVGGVQVGTGATCVATVSGTGDKTAVATVSNSSGNVTSSAAFFIYSDYTITVSPTTKNAISGESVTFTATFTGQNKHLSVMWSGPNGPVVSSGLVNDSFSCTVTAASNTVGTYTVSAGYAINESANISKSKTATLTMGTTPAPVFTTQPAPVTVGQNGPATFSAAASNTTSYDWYRDDTYVGSGSSHSPSTATTGSFKYHCYANGPGGSTKSSEVYLTVNAPSPAPVFTTQPSSISRSQNQSAVFSAAANNTTSYDWYRNNSYVGSGSSHSADTSTVGTFTYKCIANGPGGSTPSSPATLTVTAPAPVGYTNHFNVSRTVSIPQDTQHTVNIYPSGVVNIEGVNYTWASGGSANGSGYTVIASSNFGEVFGSYGYGIEYDLYATGGVSYMTPEAQFDGLPDTWTISIEVYRNGTFVSSVSVTFNENNK